MKKQFITLITLLLFSISALAQVNEEAIDYTEGDDTKVLCNQPGEANEYIFKMTPAQDDVQAWKAQLQKDGEKLSHEFHTLLTNNNIRSHRMPFEFEEQLKTAACIAQYMNKQSNENKKSSK